MAQPKRQPQPSDSSFDTRDLPSMGDPDFIDGQVRVMLDETRKVMFESKQPQADALTLIDRWAKEFSPANTAYIQTLSVDALNTFLRARGLGTDDVDDEAPVKALVASMIDRFRDAAQKFHDEQIDGAQLQFVIDTVVEDMVAMIRGLDNPAD